MKLIELYKYPLKSTGCGLILDANDKTVLEVRGWGYLTGQGGLGLDDERAELAQIAIEEDVVKDLNEAHNRRASMNIVSNWLANESKTKNKQYEIWSEGYMATGEKGTAHMHGICEGESFKDACIKFFTPDKEGYSHFDPESMSFWSCRLFDNETDARKRFG